MPNTIGATNLIMRTTDSTGSTLRVNFNDGITYLAEWYYLGTPTRDETWIHPDGGFSYLARVQDRPTQATLSLHVLASGAATTQALLLNILRVRNEFEQSVNYLELGMGGTLFPTLSVTRALTVATYNSIQPHGLVAGQRVRIENIIPDNYNSTYSIAGVPQYGTLTTGAYAFGFTVLDTPTTTSFRVTGILGSPTTPATVQGKFAGASVFERFRTYPSVIEPATGEDSDSMARAVAQRLVIDWTFSVWRDPYANGAGTLGDAAATTHHPVI